MKKLFVGFFLLAGLALFGASAINRPVLNAPHDEEQTGPAPTTIIPTGDHHLPAPPRFDNIVTVSSEAVLKVDAYLPQEMAIKCGSGFIRINMQTGSVELPKDVPLDAAARQFWLAIADAFPEARRAIIAGEKSQPLGP